MKPQFTVISSRLANGLPTLDAITFCADVRGVGDYGSDVRVDANQATEAIKAARRILLAIHDALPTHFPALPGEDERVEK